MQIFQLIPITLENNEQDWLSSTPKEIVIVRAVSEKSAREIVNCATTTAALKTRKSQKSPLSPWNTDKLSSCNLYHGNEYNVEGEEEILSPAWLQEEWKVMYSNKENISLGLLIPINKIEAGLKNKESDIEKFQWYGKKLEVILQVYRKETCTVIQIDEEKLLDFISMEISEQRDFIQNILKKLNSNV